MTKNTIISQDFITGEVIGGAGDSTQIGGDIPDGKTRYIIGIIWSTDATAVDQLQLFLGETANQQATRLITIDTLANGIGSPGHMGSFDEDKPILVCRSQKALDGGAVTGNRVGAAHKTAGIDGTLVYYDK